MMLSKPQGPLCMLSVGWRLAVTDQSLMLYSRLNLVSAIRCKLQLVMDLIVVVFAFVQLPLPPYS